jgi:hypothetical protein
MSKAYRKLLKEKEEQKMAEAIKEEDLKSYNIATAKKSTNIFGNFGANDSSDSESDSHEDPVQESKPDKDQFEAVSKPDSSQKKEVTPEAREIPKSPEADITKPKKKKNKPKKKKPAKQAQETHAKDKEEEDFIITEETNAFDKMQTNVSLTGVGLVGSNYDFKGSINPSSTLLAINVKQFNYNKELDRYFKGSRLVESNSDQYGHMNKRDRNILKHQMKSNKPKKKYCLVHNDDVIHKLPDKLEMEILAESSAVKVFAFKPTAKLESLHESYQSVKDTSDPAAVQDFLVVNPYFPEALYDLGEYFRLNGKFKEANFMLEKLLFFYEESFSFEFNIFGSEGGPICFLDHSKNIFNEILFRALLKFLLILSKKACYKAALEYNKLLLKLNPFDDPMGALIMIDHSALSAQRFEWFNEFALNFGRDYFGPRFSILLYPNIIFSHSLSLFREQTSKMPQEKISDYLGSISDDIFARILNFEWRKDESDCNFWLVLALLLFPELLRAILNVTEMQKQNPTGKAFTGWQKKSWNDLLGHPAFKEKTDTMYYYPFLNITNQNDLEGLKKVVSIYADRNKLIWRDNLINIWLKSVAGAITNFFDAQPERLEAFHSELLWFSN